MSERDIRSAASPALTPKQLADLGGCGAVGGSACRDGEASFRVGDRDSRSFVVLSGTVEILDLCGLEARRVALHPHCDFTSRTGRPG